MKLMAQDGFFPDEDMITSCSCMKEYMEKLPECGMFSIIGSEESAITTTMEFCEDIPDVCGDIKLFAVECLGTTYKDSALSWASMSIEYADDPGKCHAVQYQATHCPSTASLVWEVGTSALSYCLSSPSGLTKAELAALSSFSDACPHYFTDSYSTTQQISSSIKKYNYDITRYPPLLLFMMAAIIGAGCYFIVRRRRGAYSDLKDPESFGSTLFSSAASRFQRFRRKGEPVYSQLSTDDMRSSSVVPSLSSSSSSVASASSVGGNQESLEKGMFGNSVLGVPFQSALSPSSSSSSSSNYPGRSKSRGSTGYGASGHESVNPLVSSANLSNVKDDEEDDDGNSFTM